jgi:hypothetical protein
MGYVSHISWMPRVIKTTLQKYATAIGQWTQGMGGGSGYPSHFVDWNEKEASIFVDY